MTPPCRFFLVGAFFVSAAVVPGLGQNTGAKIVPKLQPVAETKLLMEGLAHPNFRGLERNLSKETMDDATWMYARGQALLIAECANLLMLRPPKGTQSQPTWFQATTDLRTQATRLAQTIAKKDLAGAKAGMQQLARSCNRCHQSFRVPVEIMPFQPAPPPVRKI